MRLARHSLTAVRIRVAVALEAFVKSPVVDPVRPKLGDNPFRASPVKVCTITTAWFSYLEEFAALLISIQPADSNSLSVLQTAGLDEAVVYRDTATEESVFCRPQC